MTGEYRTRQIPLPDLTDEVREKLIALPKDHDIIWEARKLYRFHACIGCDENNQEYLSRILCGFFNKRLGKENA